MDEKKKSLLCFGCDFSGWYNFGKIIKIVATRCHILKLKCSGAPPVPIAGLKGPTSKGKEGRERKGKRWEGKG